MPNELSKILVLESNTSIGLKDILLEKSNLKLHIDSTQKIEEGIQLMTRNPYDAIIVDTGSSQHEYKIDHYMLDSFAKEVPVIVIRPEDRRHMGGDTLVVQKPLTGNVLDTSKSEQIIQILEERIQLFRNNTSHRTRKNHTQFFPTVLQNIQDSIIVTDFDGIISFVNYGSEQLFGYSETDLQGKHISLIHDCPRNVSSLIDDVRRGKIIEYEGSARCKDGSSVWIHTKMAPMKNGSDEPSGIISFSTNISERKLLIEQLQRNEERFHLAERVAHIGSWEIDFERFSQAKDTTVYWSPECYSILGLAPGTVPLEDFYRIIHPDDRNQVMVDFQKAMTDGIQLGSDFRILRPDGIRNIHLVMEVIKGSDKKLSKAVGIIQDMTESKRLEDRMRITQKMESIGKLAGGIAHDFNNILGIILGHVEFLIRAEKKTDHFEKSVDTIRRTVHRGSALVKQLLTFSRQSEPVFRTCNVNDVIVEIAGMVRETFPKSLTLITNLQPDLPTIVADSNQLYQVILNLVVNAHDAVGTRGHIIINTFNISGYKVRQKFISATTGSYVAIQVIDNGIGMNDEVRQRIFEPFFTTKEKEKGTGLGLAVVFGIVKKHEGYIDVESEVNKGTTFTVYVPANADLKRKHTEYISVDGSQTTHGNETILFVEDEDSLRDLMASTLRDVGYTVLTASNGIQGFTQFAESADTIDIVLADVDIPVFDGIEMTKHIKMIKPNVSMIMASGYLDARVKQKLREQGVTDFINKPYSPELVLNTIRTVVQQKRNL